MATAFKVEAAVPGRKRAGTAEHPLELDLPVDRAVPLRAVVEAVVRAEVDAFRRRAEEQRFVRVLTDRALAGGLPSHRERSRAVAIELDGLSEGDRLDVTTALHPALGRALARWWSDGATSPTPMAMPGVPYAPREIERRLKVWQPRRAAVLSAGTIGLMAAMVLRLRGLDVTVFGRDLPPFLNGDLVEGLGPESSGMTTLW